MQTIGHLNFGCEKIKVLIRPNIRGGYVSLKKREYGELGKSLDDETLFLMDRPDLVKALQDGKVVKL